MAALGQRLRTRARHLWRWLFPEEVELPEETRRALAALYPSLDLGRVRFHRGIPHFLARIGSGITLPGVLAPRLCRIYIRRWAWHPETPDGLALLAHEAFHALQMQEVGPGVGMVRPFIVLYLACAAGNGFHYRSHPLEVDAYRFEGRLRSFLASAPAAALAEIAVDTSGVAFWRRLTTSSPGGLLGAPFWLLVWTGITVLLWLAWLLTVALGSLVTAAMWIAGTLLPEH